MLGGGDQSVARVGGVAVLDTDQARVRFHPVGAGEQPVGVLDPVRGAAVAGEHGLGGGAVPREVGVAQPGPSEHRQVVRRRDLPGCVVAVGRDDVGVAGAQGAGLGLHLGGGARPAAVHRGEHVHGVVAGVEEDTAPQVRHAVGDSLGHADHAAARADALQLLLPDGVPGAAGHRREDGEGEQGLEGAGGRQPAVGVVCGEHVAAAGVGHHPGQRGDVLGDLGCPGQGPYLCPSFIQRRGWRRGGLRRPRARIGECGGRALRGGQHTDDADGGAAEGGPRDRGARSGGPEWESDSHTANVGTDSRHAGVAGPSGGVEHPDAADAGGQEGRVG